MSKIIKAIFTIALFVLFINNAGAQVTGSYNGIWYTSSDPNHSIELFSDGSFLEMNGRNNMITGHYTVGSNGQLTLNYSPSYSSIIRNPVTYDRFTLNGNNMTLYLGSTPLTWSRSTINTYTPMMTDMYTSSTSRSTGSPGMTGVWYSNAGQSIEFFSDGSFLENNNGVTRTGIYSLGSDGKMTLTYSAPSGIQPNIVYYDKFTVNGDNITYYLGGTPMTYTRSYVYEVPRISDTYASKPGLYKRPSVDINGIWHLSSDGEHTIHFMNDGTFTEMRNGVSYSGTYSIDDNNILTMSYSTPSSSVSTYDRLMLNGNDLIWYSGDAETKWTRGVGNTDMNMKLKKDDKVNPSGSTIEDKNKVDRDVIKRGNTNDPYMNETKDAPETDKSKENQQNIINEREKEKKQSDDDK